MLRHSDMEQKDPAVASYSSEFCKVSSCLEWSKHLTLSSWENTTRVSKHDILLFNSCLETKYPWVCCIILFGMLYRNLCSTSKRDTHGSGTSVEPTSQEDKLWTLSKNTNTDTRQPTLACSCSLLKSWVTQAASNWHQPLSISTAIHLGYFTLLWVVHTRATDLH